MSRAPDPFPDWASLDNIAHCERMVREMVETYRGWSSARREGFAAKQFLKAMKGYAAVADAARAVRSQGTVIQFPIKPGASHASGS
jgi:hypothetical protein